MAKQDRNKEQKKLGIALVGLGTYSEQELGPALKETNYCYLAGVVSSERDKCEQWQKEYNLKDENLYSYDDFDEISSNKDIDIVYVVLPNDMHAEFVTRAAKAGKHVICEKPMATTVEDCQRMIDACREAGVKLAIGYRLHYDPYHQEMMRLGQDEVYGKVKKLIAKNGMDVGDENQWRLDREDAGGGPLMDVGIYCVQGVIYTKGALPVSVTARFTKKHDAQKFDEVEEGLTWEMQFADGTEAFCETSYVKEMNLLRAEAENGWFELAPVAYEYRGISGRTSDGPMHFKEVRQQALQMDDFARCIMEGRESIVPGEMGMRDVQILKAIYEAASTGKKVELHLEPYENLVEM